jgi:hypothetical protein
MKDEFLTLKDSLEDLRARTGCVATGLAGEFVVFFVILSSFQAAVGGFSSVSGLVDGVFWLGAGDSGVRGRNETNFGLSGSVSGSVAVGEGSGLGGSAVGSSI